jgi:hypothetical protein
MLGQNAMPRHVVQHPLRAVGGGVGEAVVVVLLLAQR